jgi:hypothetical protein
MEESFQSNISILIRRYKIFYRQEVGSEDIFLGMSGLSNSILHCQWIVIRIELPEIENIQDIDMNCTSQLLEVRTKKQ